MVAQLPGVPAVLELGGVAVQVLLADVVVRPIKRPLELGEERLGQVGADPVTYVLTRRVVHGAVRRERPAERRVGVGGVSVQVRLLGDAGLLKDRPEGVAVDVRYHPSPDVARLLVHQGDYRGLVGEALLGAHAPVGVAVFEALRINNMTKSAAGSLEAPGRNVAAKSGLNRVILNEGWGTLLDLIRYKMADNGGSVVTVPAPFTSLTCHACGSTAPGQRKNQALFVCEDSACGWTGNADFNAACNILMRAVSGGLIPTLSAGIVDDARSRYELEKRPDAMPPAGTKAPLKLGGPGKRENRLSQRTVAV